MSRSICVKMCKIPTFFYLGTKAKHFPILSQGRVFFRETIFNKAPFMTFENYLSSLKPSNNEFKYLLLTKWKSKEICLKCNF